MIKTLKGRLALIYTLLFALMSLGVFISVYEVMSRNLSARIDEELLDDAQEIVEVFEESGLQKAGLEIDLEVEGGQQKTRYYRIFSPDRELLEATDLGHWQGLPTPVYPHMMEQTVFHTETVAGHEFNVRTISWLMKGGFLLEVGFEPVEDGELFLAIEKVFFTAFGLLVLIGAILGFALSRYALKGIDQLRASFAQVGKGDFRPLVHQKSNGEEIDTLIDTYNTMQERIQSLVTELKDVTDNIAHDLRSPITRIRGMSETCLTGPQDPVEYRETLASIIEDCDSLVGMINTMLEIAASDAGVIQIANEHVDISSMLTDVADIFQPVAEDEEIDLSVTLPDSGVVINGDRARLQRAVANLVDNALKFTPAGGRVNLSVRSDDASVTILIADTGAGISLEEQQKIFSRFYRSDASRTLPGNGLGLSLVQAIAHLHGGGISLQSSVGQGSTFCLRLPTKDV